jgi:preprotein translocase subunit SecD
MVIEDDPWMRALFAKVGSKRAKKSDDPTNGEATDPLALSYGIKADTDTWRPEGGNKVSTDYYLYASDATLTVSADDAKRFHCLDGQPPPTTETVSCALTGRQIIQMYLEQLAAAEPTYKVPDDRQIGYEKVERGGEGFVPHWRTYYLDRAVRLSGSSITNASVAYDPTTYQPYVSLQFDRYGGRIFGDLTAQNIGKKFATILDDKVQSAPVINSAIRGGSAQITMGGGNADTNEKEAKDLVDVLKTGSLPAPLQQESISDVGPTLGRDAIDKAKLAFGLGIGLVVLLMVFVYRWSGWFAVGAVVINLFMMLAAMVALDATLTLPGIAALVLTVGVAVDGNILIYERIRDELLLGKSVRGAIDLGFARAFSAILDAQLTGAAAAWVLMQYGSGPIKGFAVMSLLGIATTLFTNIWVGRLFFDWYVAKKKGQSATISI